MKSNLKHRKGSFSKVLAVLFVVFCLRNYNAKAQTKAYFPEAQLIYPWEPEFDSSYAAKKLLYGDLNEIVFFEQFKRKLNYTGEVCRYIKDSITGQPRYEVVTEYIDGYLVRYYQYQISPTKKISDIQEIKFTYENENSIINSRHYFRDQLSMKKYYFNKNHLLDSVRLYGNNTIPETKYLFQYDHNNRLIRYSEYYLNEKATFTVSFDYEQLEVNRFIIKKILPEIFFQAKTYRNTPNYENDFVKNPITTIEKIITKDSGIYHEGYNKGNFLFERYFFNGPSIMVSHKTNRKYLDSINYMRSMHYNYYYYCNLELCLFNNSRLVHTLNWAHGEPTMHSSHSRDIVLENYLSELYNFCSLYIGQDTYSIGSSRYINEISNSLMSQKLKKINVKNIPFSIIVN